MERKTKNTPLPSFSPHLCVLSMLPYGQLGYPFDQLASVVLCPLPAPCAFPVAGVMGGAEGGL